MNENEIIWDTTSMPGQVTGRANAISPTPPREAPKKITVFVEDFCNYCGKTRNTSLIRMQHGFAWYCLPCQLRYRLKVFVGKLKGEAQAWLRKSKEQRVK